MQNILRVGLIGSAAIGMSMASGAAYATPPGPGVTGTTISQTTVGGTDYILRKVTIPPGQSTGWHYHDGTLYGSVEQGTLSHFDATCKSDGVYQAGDSLTEPSGSKNVHIGRNLGTTPMVLEVLYVLPHGAPLSEDAPNPGCSFQ
ncbi:cupin domain-containing protein [Streptomyces sp. NBC_01456]|uniref:cupin domain-containing protein n=1 Tax=unclassified Streptomyces TaxID=2593676 RepID=UPI002E358D19|nr:MULTISPECIES: cupin domain-containing protein [unclassified Streptomyces]